MKEKLLIFLALGLLIAVLVGLNAVSYVQKEKEPDRETKPNRSTYNVGATGTRAFYDLLAESGRKVSRWQKPPSALLNYEADNPTTLVVIGSIQREFDEAEFESLLKWVSDGGKLVVIDRAPPEELIKTTASWKVSMVEGDSPFFNTDPSDQKQMTGETDAAKPVQPTVFTKKVNAVQTSRFASSVSLSRLTEAEVVKDLNGPAKRIETGPPPPAKVIENEETDAEEDKPTEPPRVKTERVPKEGSGSGQGSGSGTSKTGKNGLFADPTPVDFEPMITPTPELVEETAELTAPVVHLADKDKNLLVDFPYGSGQIVFLTDPYIVSNSGIGLVDNSQLAINLVASNQGIIAFDEYHQGYGSSNNLLLNYFEGTPVFAFLLQLAALLAFLFFTQSRRFARALPAFEPNRLSKLEYVSAMAELQQRTRAFDLAIENIYKDFRRRASRLVGVDNFTTSRTDLAKLLAERLRINTDEIDQLMFKCEDIMHGEPTNKKEVLDLIGRLREIENSLGLQRRNSRF